MNCNQDKEDLDVDAFFLPGGILDPSSDNEESIRLPLDLLRNHPEFSSSRIEPADVSTLSLNPWAIESSKVPFENDAPIRVPPGLEITPPPPGFQAVANSYDAILQRTTTNNSSLHTERHSVTSSADLLVTIDQPSATKTACYEVVHNEGKADATTIDPLEPSSFESDPHVTASGPASEAVSIDNSRQVAVQSKHEGKQSTPSSTDPPNTFFLFSPLQSDDTESEDETESSLYKPYNLPEMSDEAETDSIDRLSEEVEVNDTTCVHSSLETQFHPAQAEATPPSETKKRRRRKHSCTTTSSSLTDDNFISAPQKQSGRRSLVNWIWKHSLVPFAHRIRETLLLLSNVMGPWMHSFKNNIVIIARYLMLFSFALGNVALYAWEGASMGHFSSSWTVYPAEKLGNERNCGNVRASQASLYCYAFMYCTPGVCDWCMTMMNLPYYTPHVVSNFFLFYVSVLLNRAPPTKKENQPRLDHYVGRCILHTMRVAIPVSFFLEGFEDTNSSVMLMESSHRLIVAYSLSLTWNGRILSPLAWVGWAVQMLLSSYCSSCATLDAILLFIGLAFIRLVDTLQTI